MCMDIYIAGKSRRFFVKWGRGLKSVASGANSGWNIKDKSGSFSYHLAELQAFNGIRLLNLQETRVA